MIDPHNTNKVCLICVTYTHILFGHIYDIINFFTCFGLHPSFRPGFVLPQSDRSFLVCFLDLVACFFRGIWQHRHIVTVLFKMFTRYIHEPVHYILLYVWANCVFIPHKRACVILNPTADFLLELFPF